MAGTKSSRRLPKSQAREKAAGGPAIILVRPQLAENIGMAARSMLNFGLLDLRLVAPREGWPNEKAFPPSSGADEVLNSARVYPTTAKAVADLQFVYATSARVRDMVKTVATPETAARDIRTQANTGKKCGILFGRESKGLDNDDVALADALLMAPLNPAFSSLNLAQAVLLVGYEWYRSADNTPDKTLPIPKDTRPANKEELVQLFEHLERELDACGFLRVKEKRPIMVRNLRNIFQRAQLTEQEVRTLRGVIKSLAEFPRNRKKE
ncbi:MAG: RNA methyltransferase [Rhodospirillales bacterium]|nr:RNA methyltransferase [Rhodospirillales bacterium]